MWLWYVVEAKYNALFKKSIAVSRSFANFTERNAETWELKATPSTLRLSQIMMVSSVDNSHDDTCGNWPCAF